MTTKAKQTQQQEALAHLRDALKPGDIVYTMLRSVSKSGMSRQISLFIVRDGELQNITQRVAVALGYTVTDKNSGGNWAIRVQGTGMDMGFHLVYNLSSVVFRLTEHDTTKDAGYLLNQRWL